MTQAASATLTDTPTAITSLTPIPVRATDDRPAAPSIRRLTLPPPFTPTPTYTATLTATLTLTPTSTPTLTTEQICELFIAGANKGNGATYTAGEMVIFRLNTQGVQNVTMRTEFNHAGSDEGFHFEFPGGERLITAINPVDFPVEGDYTWRATLNTDDDSEICVQEGTLTIDLPEATEEATPELTEETPEATTEEATAEMTEAIQVVTATPRVIIVTVTPEPSATPRVIIVTATPEPTPTDTE
jgi:hypothetical protein